MGAINWAILRDRNKEKVLEFLAQGGDLNHPENHDKPIEWLCYLCRDAKSQEEFDSYLEFFDFMIDKGFDPQDGINTICAGSFHSMALPLLALFVRKGGDVNLPEPGSGWTPLLAAVRIKAPDLVEALIGYGAIPKAIDLFIPASQISLMGFDRANLSKILKQYERFHLNLNEYLSFDKETLLGVALCNKEDFMVSWLLGHGADPNKPIIDDGTGRTPLMALAPYARLHKNVGHYADLLLEKGANIHAVDSSGLTAMDYAVRHKNEQLIEALNDYKNRHSATGLRLTFRVRFAEPEIASPPFNVNKLFFK